MTICSYIILLPGAGVFSLMLSRYPLVAQCMSPRLVIIYFVFVAAGVFCAIVSHPADTIVSKLNQQKGSSIAEVARKLGFMGEQQLIIH